MFFFQLMAETARSIPKETQFVSIFGFKAILIKLNLTFINTIKAHCDTEKELAHPRPPIHEPFGAVVLCRQRTSGRKDRGRKVGSSASIFSW